MFSRCIKNCCYFCDICGLLEGLLCLINFKSFLVLNLLFLLLLRYLLGCIFTLREKFLFGDFCDICGLLEGLLCLFNFQVFSFVKFVILAILAIFARVCFHVASKILVTFAMFAAFADFSRAFLPLYLSSLFFC